MAMKKVLLTGFEPFLSNKTNPTMAIVQALNHTIIKEHIIIGEVLPVTFTGARAKLRALIKQEQPHIVIALGLASNRTTITPERVAINCMDGAPDNEGYFPQNEPIGNTAAYFSTLPIYQIVDALEQAGFEAKISNTAGTYVCNAVMYELLSITNEQLPAGFIHIPPVLKNQQQAIEICIAITIGEIT